MTYKTDRIFVANHQSVVGSAIVRRLTQLGHPRTHIVSCPPGKVSWQNYSSIRAFFADERPDQVYLWGMRDLLSVPAPGALSTRRMSGSGQEPVGTAHIVEAALRSGVKRLINVACDAELEETHGHSVGVPQLGNDLDARFSFLDGMVLCHELTKAYGTTQGVDYRAVQVCETYGPGWPASKDWIHNPGDPSNRLIAEPLHAFDHAMETSSGRAILSFAKSELFDLMYSDDVADAVVFLKELAPPTFLSGLGAKGSHVFVNSGAPISGEQLAQALSTALGFQGQAEFEPVTRPTRSLPAQIQKPNARAFGWRPSIDMSTGLELTAMAYRISQVARRKRTLHSFCGATQPLERNTRSQMATPVESDKSAQ